MELMFVTLGGALIGIAAHYLMPGRHTQGTILVPGLGAAFSAVLWVALTWAGLAWNGGWIWWITLLATAVVTLGVGLVVGRVRTHADERDLAAYMKAGVPSAD